VPLCNFQVLLQSSTFSQKVPSFLYLSISPGSGGSREKRLIEKENKSKKLIK